MKSKKQQDDVLEDDFARTKSQLDYFPKWQELKPLGKNIHRRSYHSCVVWDNYIYIYGGYETNEGILDDLMRIPVPNMDKALAWNEVYKKHSKDTIGPGPLRNHTAVVHQQKMYLFGGKENLIYPCSKLWIFDFQQEEWEEGQSCNINNQEVCAEGHNSCMFVQGDIAQMIVFGGFYPDKGYVSNVLSYDIQQNAWSMICEQHKHNCPQGRAGAGATIQGTDLYVFGGCNYEQRFSDFWKFDLLNKKWDQIKTEKSPGSRSSSILVQHNQGLYLFGGIHDITHEKNDLWMFKNNEWILLEEDNSRRQVNDELNDSLDKASQSKPVRQKEKVNKMQEMQNRSFFIFGEDNELRSPQKRGSLKNIVVPAGVQKQSTEPNNQSQATNNMEELKKRRWQQKKMQMLAEFELTEDEKQKFKSSSPTTDQIKNSINLITNSDKGGQRKISSPVAKKQQQAQLIGKKPCARDGHSVVVASDVMIVFGGDRNLMSFNDLYMYSFNSNFIIQKQK